MKCGFEISALIPESEHPALAQNLREKFGIDFQIKNIFNGTRGQCWFIIYHIESDAKGPQEKQVRKAIAKIYVPVVRDSILSRVKYA